MQTCITFIDKKKFNNLRENFDNQFFNFSNIYLCGSAYVVQEKYRKEIDGKCFKFIWNNKPDKVKRTTVVGKLGNGGLKIIDIQNYFMSLKASWVSRLVSNQLVNWKVIPRRYFAKFGKEWLFCKIWIRMVSILTEFR
jgi:hypothetical protein